MKQYFSCDKRGQGEELKDNLGILESHLDHQHKNLQLTHTGRTVKFLKKYLNNVIHIDKHILPQISLEFSTYPKPFHRTCACSAIRVNAWHSRRPLTSPIFTAIFLSSIFPLNPPLQVERINTKEKTALPFGCLPNTVPQLQNFSKGLPHALV